jgi:hypothetical protein
MIYQHCFITLSWKNPLDNYKEKESSGEPIQRFAVLSPTTVRDTKKLASSNIQPPAHPTFKKPDHDNKAYLVGQQLLQSMPQSLAKSRTNPATKE